MATQESSERVVVLKNGRVLRGKVTYLGDRCLIGLKGGGDIRIPSTAVSVDADSLQHAYSRMRDTLASPQSAGARVNLASWCMREGLLDEAAAELLEAMRLDPDHAGIEPAYRQLRYLGEARTPRAPSTPRPPRAAAREAEGSASAGLPKEVMAEFPATIQPLLMNRCAGGRCHEAPSKAEFQLQRPTHGSGFWRRLTLKNLDRVLAQIDSASPDQSPLLVEPSKPHGGLDRPVFSEKETAQWEVLNAWVLRAARRSSPIGSVATANGEPSADAGDPLLGPPSAFAVPEGVSPLPNPEPSESRDRVTEGAALEPSQPVDPLDPAIFNRRFGKSSSGAERRGADRD
ncbi:MAG: hypothetical protein FJ297_13080 [Planctomycetes bacterium]|nr:hypothetical protein [Planctomycetota bacterium]